MANGTLKVGEITTSTGSGNITIGSGVTLNSNTPAFAATLSADQSISNSTATKVTLDTESFDTDSAFASNKFTVPSGRAGKYLFIGNVGYVNLTNEDESRAMIYKNGAIAASVATFQGQNGSSGLAVQAILDLAVDDYIELYALQVSGGAISVDGGATGITFLQGYKLGA
jgi:hypothetical protein